MLWNILLMVEEGWRFLLVLFPTFDRFNINNIQFCVIFTKNAHDNIFFVLFLIP
jgi:hypothetical protein